MAKMVEAYYKGLFIALNSTHISEVSNAVEHVVIDGMRQSLLLPYSLDEVSATLFQMHPSKSLGPDGMSPYFFQKFWHILGPDVTSVVISILHLGRYLHKMNYTHIVLLLNLKNMKHITEYRPISLGNVISQLVLKVLANRVKTILPNVIFDS